MQKPDVTTLKNHPERDLCMTYWAIRRGIPLARRMTALERMTLAVASCGPTHLLTLSSKLDRAAFDRALQALKKRIKRRRGGLTYVGASAEALGDGGYHVHLLLWGYQHVRSLLKDVAQLGLGRVHIAQVETEPDPALHALSATSYVLSQAESVFGSQNHLRNAEHPKAKHRFLIPQDRTLAKRHPELLAAIKLAGDPAVPDDELVRALPYLVSSSNNHIATVHCGEAEEQDDP